MSKKNRNKQKQFFAEQEQQISQEEVTIGTESIESDDSIETAEELKVQDQQEISDVAESNLNVEPSKEEMQVESTTINTTPVAEKQEDEVSEPIVKEPKKEEIKPIIKQKGVLIVERKSAKSVAASAVPQTVLKFNELADKYLAVMNKGGINEEDKQKAVMILSQIAQYVVTATDTRVFDACFKFMLKNRAIMLVPEVVMDGFYKFCDKTKITKITQFYVIFQSLVQSQLLKERFTINPTTVRRTFNNDALANWLILKKK